MSAPDDLSSSGPALIGATPVYLSPGGHPTEGTGTLKVLLTSSGSSNAEVAAQITESWSAGDIVCVLDGKTPAPRLTALLDILGPEAVFRAGEWHPFGPGDRRRRSYPPVLAAIVVTSGTTAEPKMVALDRRSMSAAVAMTTTVTGTTDWYCCLPLHHVAGLSIIARGWLTGTDVRVADGFDPSEALKHGAERWVPLVATQAARVLQLGPIDSWRGLLLGGSAIPAEVQAVASEQVETHSTSGMTETWGGVVYDGLPLAGVAVRINDSVIELRTPTVMSSYLGAPQRTAAVLSNDRWFRTDDVGTIVGGRLEVLGRKDDVIVTGGVKVSPDRVEQALARVPGIVEAGVVGHPDDVWGQRVTAVIRTVGPPPTLEQVRKDLAEHLLPAELPREVRVWDEPLPRTSGGKLRRSALRATEQNRSSA